MIDRATALMVLIAQVALVALLLVAALLALFGWFATSVPDKKSDAAPDVITAWATPSAPSRVAEPAAELGAEPTAEFGAEPAAGLGAGPTAAELAAPPGTALTSDSVYAYALRPNAGSPSLLSSA